MLVIAILIIAAIVYGMHVAVDRFLRPIPFERLVEPDIFPPPKEDLPEFKELRVVTGEYTFKEYLRDPDGTLYFVVEEEENAADD